VRTAVRLLCSDDESVPVSTHTLNKLQLKHPKAPADWSASPALLASSLSVDEAEVLQAIRSFPAGSSGGPDGFRPQHLLDLVSCRESGADLLTSLMAFTNLLLQGKSHLDMTSILLGGRLVALNKKSGGIHLIAVGFTLRRLASKCANSYAVSKLTPYFAPHQMGAGVKGGCEAAVHATLRFLGSLQPGSVIAKLDFSNAFNCLHRDSMLEAVSQQISEIYNYCHSAYTHHSVLWFDEQVIWSE